MYRNDSGETSKSKKINFLEVVTQRKQTKHGRDCQLLQNISPKQ
jgi:hypothetical protein